MKKKQFKQLEKLLGSLPAPQRNVEAEISNCNFNATNKADLALATAAGKLADAIKVLADKPTYSGTMLTINTAKADNDTTPEEPPQ